MRTRSHILLTNGRRTLRMTSAVAFMACAVIGGLAGCGQGASGEYRDFSSLAEKPKTGADEQLPTITPGKPGESDAETKTTDAANDVTADAGGIGEPNNTSNGTTPAVADANDAADTDSTTEPGNADPVDPTPGVATVQEEPGTRDEIVSEAREVKLLIPSKDFARDKETRALRVSYDDIDLLKVLNMEPVPANAVDHFPGWLKSLDGKKVRIRGFMYPTYQATGLTAFLIARDNGICCFVRQPKVYDIISVKLAEGETSDYIEGRPFDVVGTFHIDPFVEDDELLQLYRIDEARVLAD